MTLPAVTIDHLAKAYRLGESRGGGDTLVEAVAYLALTPLRRWRHLHQLGTRNDSAVDGRLLWALDDICLEIAEGETLGVIGRNGAGKSTLLKILSRITSPTRGRVEVRGRVSSLLEVGTGFHPELTGRENVYLNGTILGMKRREVAGKFDEIVAFSGVERFLDTPVKRYSSGMKVRLAFSVAAHLDPEILIVDEVLAVGDADFQGKCLGKMKGVAASGRTVLFVSHNMGAVQQMCSRAVTLRNGRLVDDGDPADVVSRYLSQIHESGKDAFSPDNPERTNSGMFRFVSGAVEDAQGRVTHRVISGEPISLQIEYAAEQPLSHVNFRFTVFNEAGIAVTTMSTKLTGDYLASTKRRGSVICKLPRNPFALGDYHVDVIARGHGKLLDSIPAALRFSVTDSTFFGTPKTPKRDRGICYVDHEWTAKPD